MSLIPSESAHFPDLIGQRHRYGNPSAPRPSLKRTPTEAPARPTSLAVPKEPEDNRDALKSQNGVSRKANPSKTTDPVELVPKNMPAETSRSLRAALPNPPQRSVAQMRSKIQTKEIATQRPVTRPRTPPRGLTAAHLTSSVGEKPTKSPGLPRQRRIKLVRFIVWEMIAIAVLIFVMKFGFFHHSTDDPLSLYLKILAVVAAVVPILFYGLPETLPRSER